MNQNEQWSDREYYGWFFFIVHKSSNLFNQEMERVWSQYERLESELSVIRSHLQHICNFGVPQVFARYNLDTFFY